MSIFKKPENHIKKSTTQDLTSHKENKDLLRELVSVADDEDFLFHVISTHKRKNTFSTPEIKQKIHDLHKISDQKAADWITNPFSDDNILSFNDISHLFNSNDIKEAIKHLDNNTDWSIIKKNNNQPRGFLHTFKNSLNNKDFKEIIQTHLHKNPENLASILEKYNYVFNDNEMKHFILNSDKVPSSMVRQYKHLFNDDETQELQSKHGLMNDKVKFHPAAEKLHDLKHLVKELGGNVKWSEVKKMGYDIPEAAPAVSPQGDLSYEDLSNHIESLKTKEFNISHDDWDRKVQVHSKTQHNRVMRFDITPEQEERINANPEVKDLFNTISKNISSKSTHPINLGKTAGWARYSIKDNQIHLDEIQTDYSDKVYKHAIENKTTTPEATKELHSILWGDDNIHPSRQMNAAFLESARQSNLHDNKVHIWDAEPKSVISGLDLDKNIPAHMKEGYSKSPKKLGFTPSQYGELSVQDNEKHTGQPTWSKTLRKSEDRDVLEKLKNAETHEDIINHLDDWYTQTKKKNRNQDIFDTNKNIKRNEQQFHSSSFLPKVLKYIEHKHPNNIPEQLYNSVENLLSNTNIDNEIYGTPISKITQTLHKKQNDEDINNQAQNAINKIVNQYHHYKKISNSIEDLEDNNTHENKENIKQMILEHFDKYNPSNLSNEIENLEQHDNKLTQDLKQIKERAVSDKQVKKSLLKEIITTGDDDLLTDIIESHSGDFFDPKMKKKCEELVEKGEQLELTHSDVKHLFSPDEIKNTIKELDNTESFNWSILTNPDHDNNYSEDNLFYLKDLLDDQGLKEVVQNHIQKKPENTSKLLEKYNYVFNDNEMKHFILNSDKVPSSMVHQYKHLFNDEETQELQSKHGLMNDKVKFHPTAEKLHDLKHLVKELGGNVKWSEVKKMGYDIPEAAAAVSPQGNLSYEDLSNHIESLKTKEFNISHDDWDHELQVHSNKQANKVMRFDITPEQEKRINANPEVKDLFNTISNISSKSSHPVRPGKTAGWARYSIKDNQIHLDEIQTDYSDKAYKYAIENKTTTPEATKELHSILWGDDNIHPSRQMNAAFLESARQSNLHDNKIHVWDAKPKSVISGLDLDKNIPAHMKEGYSKSPKKLGFTPSQYGELSVQDNEKHTGQPTWSKTLRKSNLKDSIFSQEDIEKGLSEYRKDVNERYDNADNTYQQQLQNIPNQVDRIMQQFKSIHSSIPKPKKQPYINNLDLKEDELEEAAIHNKFESSAKKYKEAPHTHPKAAIMKAIAHMYENPHIEHHSDIDDSNFMSSLLTHCEKLPFFMKNRLYKKYDKEDDVKEEGVKIYAGHRDADINTKKHYLFDLINNNKDYVKDIVRDQLKTKYTLEHTFKTKHPELVHYDDNNEAHINLFRAMDVPKDERRQDLPLASYSVKPLPVFGNCIYEHSVPLKHVWYSYLHNNRDNGSFGHESEILVSPPQDTNEPIHKINSHSFLIPSENAHLYNLEHNPQYKSEHEKLDQMQKLNPGLSDFMSKNKDRFGAISPKLLEEGGFKDVEHPYYQHFQGEISGDQSIDTNKSKIYKQHIQRLADDYSSSHMTGKSYWNETNSLSNISEQGHAVTIDIKDRGQKADANHLYNNINNKPKHEQIRILTHNLDADRNFDADNNYKVMDTFGCKETTDRIHNAINEERKKDKIHNTIIEEDKK